MTSTSTEDESQPGVRSGYGSFIARHEDALLLGPPGTGQSHLAQAIGQSAIQQGYRETHKL